LPLGAVPAGLTAGQYDIWYSLVWGTRNALLFGLGVVALTGTLGVLVGATSAYFGGWLNRLSMGFTDAFLTLPLIAGVVFFRELVFLAMQSTGMRVWMDGSLEFPGPPTTWQLFLTRLDPLFLAFFLLSWMPYARLMNSAVMAAHKAEYIQAVYALGAGHARIILRHLIPNTISPALVLAARDIGFVVLMHASFTFIGLGKHSEWGQILSLARNWVIGPGGSLLTFWWVFGPPSLALVLFGLGWNLLGDGLADGLSQERGLG
jgi:peptide/nickel transport system permease protein